MAITLKVRENPPLDMCVGNYSTEPDEMLNPKKKIFEQIQVCTIMLLIMIIRWTFFIINFVITSSLT